MTDGEALLRAVLVDPADDAPRLIYADWLDEHGQPDRAEFVRAQVEAARAPAGSARRDALGRRAGELLRGEWGHFPPGAPTLDFGPEAFARGFPARTVLHPHSVMTLAPELFAALPLVAVRLFGREPTEDRLLLAPVPDPVGHFGWELTGPGAAPAGPEPVGGRFPDVLPRALWDRLTGYAREWESGVLGTRWRLYPSPGAAHAAASRAAVAYGRERAGLPALGRGPEAA